MDGTSGESKLILEIVTVFLFLMGSIYLIKMLELGYVMTHKKPLFVHFPFFLKTLPTQQRAILEKQFGFYKNLSPKHKKYFEHRITSFLKTKQFLGRDGIVVTDEMKILIAATATMLTFGFRNYDLGLLSNIIIYPEVFYSTLNERYHKGEFNPKLRTLVLSWQDFKSGFADENDNLNLGIHEFVHAIHLNSMKQRDVSSTIFSDSF